MNKCSGTYSGMNECSSTYHHARVAAEYARASTTARATCRNSSGDQSWLAFTFCPRLAHQKGPPAYFATPNVSSFESLPPDLNGERKDWTQPQVFSPANFLALKEKIYFHFDVSMEVCHQFSIGPWNIVQQVGNWKIILHFRTQFWVRVLFSLSFLLSNVVISSVFYIRDATMPYINEDKFKCVFMTKQAQLLK